MSGNALVLRLKAKNGNHVIRQLTSDSTFQDLKEAVAKAADMSIHSMKLLAGYPPKPIMTAKGDDTLNHLKIKSGETLMVEEDLKLKAAKLQVQTHNMMKMLESQINSASGIITRHVVPANNSCLFTSINFVMVRGVLELSCAPALREIIAGVVMSDPETYNEAFLAKENGAYCEWIMRDDNWGGAIEVSILSKYYQKEICVVDTQTCRIDRFGEDQNYKERVLLLYDGIHYDPLAMESLDGFDRLKTIFSTDNLAVLQQALELAAEAKTSRQFTDVANFTLRCLICSKALKGETEAQQHAKQTGHINFGEV